MGSTPQNCHKTIVLLKMLKVTAWVLMQPCHIDHYIYLQTKPSLSHVIEYFKYSNNGTHPQRRGGGMERQRSIGADPPHLSQSGSPVLGHRGHREGLHKAHTVCQSQNDTLLVIQCTTFDQSHHSMVQRSALNGVWVVRVKNGSLQYTGNRALPKVFPVPMTFRALVCVRSLNFVL